MKKLKTLYIVSAIAVMLLVALVGSGLYMLSSWLLPATDRRNTDSTGTTQNRGGAELILSSASPRLCV